MAQPILPDCTSGLPDDNCMGMLPQTLGVYIGSIFEQKCCALASVLGPLACSEETSEIRERHKQIRGHIEL